MRWIKKGRIFNPDEQTDWLKSHAQVPTVMVMQDRLRVYFSPRNEKHQAFVSSIDLDIDDPKKIIQIQKKSILEFGSPGTFDDEGIMPSDVIESNDKIYLYYSGWNSRNTVPYHNSMGVAVSQDGGLSFERMFEGPIMDRTKEEPNVAVTPSILKENNDWRMWYVSGLKWSLIGTKYEPIYVVKSAHSKDGFNWERPNIQCLEQRHALEAFSRPKVIKIDGIYYMFFCFRHSEDYRDGTGAYRMGLATSKDGIFWQRKDHEVGIDVSENGWDSTMLCYPFPVITPQKTYLFYNGNGFGRSGFGYAELIEK